jgi:serine/threonine protein kinase
LNDQIIKGHYSFPDDFWSGVSESAKDLIRKMMCVDPTKRLSMTDVLAHPWLANDLENTARVEQIMFPSTTTTTTLKRSTCDEEAPADGTRPVEDFEEKPTGRPKRAKH